MIKEMSSVLRDKGNAHSAKDKVLSWPSEGIVLMSLLLRAARRGKLKSHIGRQMLFC